MISTPYSATGVMTQKEYMNQPVSYYFKQTGSFTSKSDGRSVPITTLFVETRSGKEREATDEEKKRFSNREPSWFTKDNLIPKENEFIREEIAGYGAIPPSVIGYPKYILGGLKGIAVEGIETSLVNRGAFGDLNKMIGIDTKDYATDIERARGKSFIIIGGTSAITKSPSASIAMILNERKIERLFYKEEKFSKKEDIAKDLLKEGVVAGVESAVFMGGFKVAGKLLEAGGLKAVESVASSNLGKTFPKITGIVGLTEDFGGKAIQFGAKTYFETQIIGTGVNILEDIKIGKYESAKLETARLTGGILGGIAGDFAGSKSFELAFTRKGLIENDVKTRIPVIQSNLLTSGQQIFIQRTMWKSFFDFLPKELLPRYDIYNPKDIKNPSKQIFFRANPKLKTGNVLTIPTFVGSEIFIGGKSISRGEGFKTFKSVYDIFRESNDFFPSIFGALKETYGYKISYESKARSLKIKDKELRKIIEEERAKKGGITSQTAERYREYQKKYGKEGLVELSDKALERIYSYEEEGVIRKGGFLTEPSRTNFMIDNRGKLILLKEVGKEGGRFGFQTILSNIKSNLKFEKEKSNLLKWESSKNYSLLRKYGELYAGVKEHSYPHFARVGEFGVILSYIEKGSEKQIEQAYKTGIMHDIVKQQEASSGELIEHGKGAYQLGIKNMLPLNIEKGWLEAIRVHDTVSGKKLAKATFEKKILKSSDVLQLGFELSSEGKIVPSRYFKGKVAESKGERGIRLEEVPIKDALGKLKEFTEKNPEKSKLLADVFRIQPSEIKQQTRIRIMKEILFNKKSLKEINKEIEKYPKNKEELINKDIKEEYKENIYKIKYPDMKNISKIKDYNYNKEKPYKYVSYKAKSYKEPTYIGYKTTSYKVPTYNEYKILSYNEPKYNSYITASYNKQDYYPSNYQKYNDLYKEQKLKYYQNYQQKKKRLPLIPPRNLLLGGDEGKKYKSTVKGFDVFVIEKGTPRLLTQGVSKSAGYDIATRELLGGLKATAFLRPSRFGARDIQTFGEFKEYKQLFRKPTKKSRFKKYGDDVIVQRQSRVGMFGGRLSFKGERSEIQKAKRIKMERYLR